MNSGYWKVLAEEQACERLVLFIPVGKRCCKVMPMGALNSYPTFLAIKMKLQMEWDTISK